MTQENEILFYLSYLKTHFQLEAAFYVAPVSKSFQWPEFNQVTRKTLQKEL